MRLDAIRPVTTWREALPTKIHVSRRSKSSYWDKTRARFVVTSSLGGIHDLRFVIHELGHLATVCHPDTLRSRNFNLGGMESPDPELRNTIPEFRAVLAASVLSRSLDWRGFCEHWDLPSATLHNDGSFRRDEIRPEGCGIEALYQSYCEDLPERYAPDVLLAQLAHNINLMAFSRSMKA